MPRYHPGERIRALTRFIDDAEPFERLICNLGNTTMTKRPYEQPRYEYWGVVWEPSGPVFVLGIGTSFDLDTVPVWEEQRS